MLAAQLERQAGTRAQRALTRCSFSSEGSWKAQAKKVATSSTSTKAHQPVQRGAAGF